MSDLRNKDWVSPPVVETEYQTFERWWAEYVKTINQRATLVWQELAWSGWFARSEIADGKEPSIFPRRGSE